MTGNNFQYFAYGSNMLHERLQARCASAKPIGTAVANGYQLAFSKRSVDGSGKATIVKSEDASDKVYGVVFKINEKERKRLDKCEGYPKGYDRNNSFDVILLRTQEKLKVVTYIAKEIDTTLVPYDWYKALVLAGARQNELEADYIEKINSIQSIPDKDLKRSSRVEAISVLKKAGFAEFVPN